MNLGRVRSHASFLRGSSVHHSALFSNYRTIAPSVVVVVVVVVVTFVVVVIVVVVATWFDHVFKHLLRHD